MSEGSVAAIHRLLKRREATALLDRFEALLPGVDLALARPDGRLFVGADHWTEADIAALLHRAGDGQRTGRGELAGQFLYVDTQPVGALLGRGPISDHEAAWESLYHSLSLILDQAHKARSLAHETLERYREINLLYQIGESIGASLNPAELPALVLAEARRVIEAAAGVVLLSDSQEDRASWPLKAGFGRSTQIEALRAAAPDLLDQVYDSGHAVIVNELPQADGGIGALLCAPLQIQDRIAGAILLGRLAEEPIFVAGDEKLLTALAGQTAIALEKARLYEEQIKRERLEEELSVARKIQLSLLPEHSPDIPGWEFAVFYRAARLVGGDYYDFISLTHRGNRLGMVMADVSGKGVSAALFMALSRSIIRTKASSGPKPAVVLKRANRLIHKDSRSNLFITAFYGILDPQSGSFGFSNAGHCRPLHLDAASGTVSELVTKGIVMGVFDPIQLEERQIDLAVGDLVVLYTDGVSEAMNAEGKLFGEERLQAVIAANPLASAQQMLDAIVAAVEVHTGDTPQSDDLTLLVFKRVGKGASR